MLFSSVTFIFFFLPFVLLFYQIAGTHRLRNLFLLIASLFFYAWGEGIYVSLMVVSIIVNYVAGLLIEKHRLKESPLAWVITIVTVIVNLSILGFFKYANFIVDNINLFLGLFNIVPVNLAPVHLPIGISFFTFQAISYVVDVYRNKTGAQKSLVGLGLYISLFPQLIAGPIIRYYDVARQIASRERVLSDLSYGVKRFIVGLAKKMIIANPLAFVADEIFGLASTSDLTTPLAWLGIICYALQIYFDFSGYSDMAIGLGRIFGFRFLENFNYPYISLSIQEFWRRWHISLSNWFKDYLYIPLGGNRHGNIKTYRNLFVVFCLCGFWHGASWNFIIWGMLHGAFIVLERGWLGHVLTKLPIVIRSAYTLTVVIIAWVFFRAETLEVAIYYLKTMSGATLPAGQAMGIGYYLDNQTLFTLALGIACSLPIISGFNQLGCRVTGSGRIQAAITPVFETARVLTLVGLLVISVSFMASNSYNPFIYFRF